MSVFVLVRITVCPFLFCNHLYKEERADCFAFIVFGIFCYCKCHVALPDGTMGRSAI